MKKMAVIVCCVLLVAGGIAVFGQKLLPRTQRAPSFSASVPTDAIVVSMRQDEYVPSELSLKKGQTVIFKNDSKDWRWPASNLHPTHELYPEFDPKEPIAAGKSWTFRFDQPGSWGMHDHLAPYITGTVKVAP